MRFRGVGNGVAIALAGLAVVIAATGTAVAVSTTVVKIADPNTPSNYAHVDVAGRLSTVGATAGIHATGFSFANNTLSFQPILTATTATLAVTSLTYDNGRNRAYPNTDFDVALAKVTVGSSGSCYDNDKTVEVYRNDSVPAGVPSVSQNFAIPLAFKSTGGKPYCIGVIVSYADLSTPSSEYAVTVAIAAFAISGSYHGTGTSSAQPQTAPLRVNAQK